MATNNNHMAIRFMARVALLATLLAGCAQPAPPAPPAPPPAQPAAAPAPSTPAEPSTVPKPVAANEPGIETMHAAIPSAKMSVSVDLRYQFDGAVLPNQPVTLHLAAVPRVAGTHLRVSVKQVAGLQIASGPLEIQKADAAGVYRQQLSLTLLAAAPENVRVLVTMDMPEGAGFGWFTIPLDGGTSAQNKAESVKQH
jgi:hypothetical protein